MNDHVTNLELSKKLKEIGYPQEGALFYWVPGSIDEDSEEMLIIDDDSWNIYPVPFYQPAGDLFIDSCAWKELPDARKDELESKIIAAPIATELLEFLPECIHEVKPGPNYLNISKGVDSYFVSYHCVMAAFKGETLVKVLAKTLIWLIENGHVKFNEGE